MDRETIVKQVESFLRGFAIYNLDCDIQSRLVKRRRDEALSEIVALAYRKAEDKVAPNFGQLGQIGETLLNEWPSISETDPNKIRYAATHARLMADKFTITSKGGYLNRVFEGFLTPREVELLVNGDSSTTEYKLLETVDEIVEACIKVKSGSCMGGTKFRDDKYHPFRVYDPKYGWKMAVRIKDGEYAGRALVNNGWVRSYCHAGSDHALEDWLKKEGFQRIGSWEKCKIAKIKNGNAYVAPYLDGGCQSVADHGEYLRIERGGELLFSETGGLVDDREGQIRLENGDWVDEDDACYVEGHGYLHVDDVTFVNGNPYHNDDVCYCEFSDDNILNDDAVETWDGRTIHRRYAVLIDVGRHRGEYGDEEEVIEDWDGYDILASESMVVTCGDSQGQHIHVDDREFFNDKGDIWVKSEYDEAHEEAEVESES